VKSSIRRFASSGLAAAFVVLLAASCDSPDAARTGALSLSLTDAPGDVVTAVITIDQIYLQPGTDEDGSRFVISDEQVTTDLLTLVGRTQLLVDSLQVPVGSYGQLRFVISGGYIEVEQAGGGTSIYASSPTYAGLPEGAVVAGSLTMPSYAQSGLKVTLSAGAIVIPEDGFVLWVVDFDVSQSFGQAAGGSGNWVMTPVVHAVVPTP
jgi:hypothetical protein